MMDNVFTGFLRYVGRYRVKVYWFCCLYVYMTTTFAQDPVCRRLTTQNGLPSNTIYNLLQDEKGYIWMAHDKGLARYDGVQFFAYRTTMRQSRSLSNLMQADNQIWAQDFTGNFYHTSGDTLLLAPAVVQQRSYFALAALLGKRTLVAFSYDSLYVNSFGKGQRKVIALPGSYEPAVLSLADTVYFTCNQSLYSFSGSKLRIVFSWPQSLPPLFFLTKTREGFIGFTKSTAPHAYLLQPGHARAISILPQGTLVQHVANIQDQIWIGTTSGAYCFNPQLQPLYEGHVFFGKHSISQIMRDKEDTYWFATLDKGLLVVPNIDTRLYRYNDEAITALARQDSNHLLLGTSSQRLLSYSLQTNTFRSLIKEASNHEIIHIFHDNVKRLTIYCADKIVIAKNFAIQKKYHFAGKSIAHLGDNHYAYAHSNGIGILQYGAQGRVLENWLIPLQKDVLRNNIRGRWVHYNPVDSILLAGTSIGLYYFSPVENGFITHKGQSIYAGGIQSNAGQTYISTYNVGVLLLEKNKTTSPVFLPPPEKTIYKIVPADSIVWMLSDETVIKYNIQTKASDFFTLGNGLPKAEYKDLIIIGSQLYMATTEGLFVLNTKTTAANTIPPSMILRKLEVNGNQVPLSKSLVLKSDENNISLYFSVLSYKHTEALKVFYSINKKEWQLLSPGVRSINLPALKSGRYSVVIKAMNEDGVACEEPLEFSFLVETPLIKKAWFIVLILFSVLSLLFGWFRYRIMVLQRENHYKTQKLQLEKELQRSKMAGIKSQMNPHFFYNALNTIQSYIYTNDKLQAAGYLSKFSDLTRLILEMSNKDFITLTDELKAIQLYLELEAERFGGKLNYKIIVSPLLQPDMVYLPPMLVQPYLENAIKHGLLHSKSKWLLNIEFSPFENGLQVIVDDNGVGRKKSEVLNAGKYRNHEPFAMSANQERLELLNTGNKEHISLRIEDKYDAHGLALGTRVELFIPYLQNIKKNFL